MKIRFVLFAFLLIIIPFEKLLSQDIEAKLSGNTPDQGFSVKDNSDSILFRVTGQGNVGIGYFNPSNKLQVNGTIGWGTSNAFLHSDHGASIELRGHGNPYIDFSGTPYSDYNVRLILEPNNVLGIDGSVAIGTNDTKGYKLAVAGNIVAEEIVVKLNENWPDYVFDKNYERPDLKELEKFIKNNGHLPKIPDAKKVNSEGIKIGEMHTKLLEKIEELTLYLIEQNKKIERLENEYNILKNKLDSGLSE